MSDPETRRALRNLAMIAVVFVLLYFVWGWADRLDSDGLKEALRWAMGTIALFALGVGMENGLRAFSLEIGKNGAKVRADGDKD